MVQCLLSYGEGIGTREGLGELIANCGFEEYAISPNPTDPQPLGNPFLGG